MDFYYNALVLKGVGEGEYERLGDYPTPLERHSQSELYRNFRTLQYVRERKNKPALWT
jgi:hypothetical protein